MAILINIDGSELKVSPKGTTAFTKDQICLALDCENIEGHILPGARYMIVAEEGKRRGWAFNARATEIFHRAGHSHDDIILGPALIVQAKEFSYGKL